MEIVSHLIPQVLGIYVSNVFMMMHVTYLTIIMSTFLVYKEIIFHYMKTKRKIICKINFSSLFVSIEYNISRPRPVKEIPLQGETFSKL